MHEGTRPRMTDAAVGALVTGLLRGLRDRDPDRKTSNEDTPRVSSRVAGAANRG